MSGNHQQIPASRMILGIVVLLNIVILKSAYLSGNKWYLLLLVTLPLLFITVKKTRQHKVRQYKARQHKSLK